jgi:hypothetical protein
MIEPLPPGADVWDEAERRGKAKRDAYASALWRDAQTPELRALLRKQYPHLFAEAPDPKSRCEWPARTNLTYPRGFHSWPLDKRNEWWAAANRLHTEAQKARRRP